MPNRVVKSLTARVFCNGLPNRRSGDGGEIIPSFRNNTNVLVNYHPVGVATVITPWNFPIAMITRKVAPALAAGCPVVIKPAELTPLSAVAIVRLAEQAGFPQGVINLVMGDAPAIGAEFCANNQVRALSFTGSTAVGKLLATACSSSVKKVSLELGGNAPFIVFDDADIDAAVAQAMLSKFRNSGQTCVCVNRFYVHSKIYAQFADNWRRRRGGWLSVTDWKRRRHRGR